MGIVVLKVTIWAVWKGLLSTLVMPFLHQFHIWDWGQCCNERKARPAKTFDVNDSNSIWVGWKDLRRGRHFRPGVYGLNLQMTQTTGNHCFYSKRARWEAPVGQTSQDSLPSSLNSRSLTRRGTRGPQRADFSINPPLMGLESSCNVLCPQVSSNIMPWAPRSVSTFTATCFPLGTPACSPPS